jgi:hypothetical protein
MEFCKIDPWSLVAAKVVLKSGQGLAELQPALNGRRNCGYQEPTLRLFNLQRRLERFSTEKKIF